TLLSVTKDDYRSRVRGSRFVTDEIDPAAEEANLASRGEVVPPGRIRPNRNHGDDEFGLAILHALVGLLAPRADFLSEGRVHPHSARPALRQAVLLPREEPITLPVFRRRRHVQVKVKLGVQRGEQLRWRLPLAALRREMHGLLPPVPISRLTAG